VTNLVDGSVKMFLYKDLPAKYHSVYKYAYEVINLIKAKIPKVKLENQTGRFHLMMNEPYPNYEAYFSNRLVVKHIVNTDVIKLATDQGEKTVSLSSGDIERLDQETQDLVKTALRYLELCLKSE
jgi:hypothetical protein